MTVAEWIKTGRVRRGLSQRALAHALKLSQGAIAQWELSATKPTLANLLDMSRLFEAPVNRLVGPGTSYPGEIVEREEELLVLHAFRKLAPAERTFFATMLRNASAPAGAVAQPSPAADRKQV